MINREIWDSCIKIAILEYCSRSVLHSGKIRYQPDLCGLNDAMELCGLEWRNAVSA